MQISELKNLFTDPSRELLHKRKMLNRAGSIGWAILRIGILLAIGGYGLYDYLCLLFQ